MDFWTLFLGQIFAVLLIVFFYYYQKINYWKKYGINGPLALPLFGNEWEKYWKGQQRCELEWFQKYGKIYGTFNDKLEPSLTIVDPELVKQIMVKDFSLFVNRAPFPGGGQTNKMLFFLENEHWKRVRAITSPAFTSGKLRTMTPLMEQAVGKLMNYFEKVSKNNEAIEVKKVISGFTIDVISSTSFGFDSKANDDRSEENPFVKTATEMFTFNFFGTVIKHFLPIALLKWFYKKKRAGKPEGGFIGEMSQEVVKQRRTTGVRRNDFIDLLVNASVSEEELKSDDYNKFTANDDKDDEVSETSQAKSSHSKLVKKLDDDEVYAQCMIFFIAASTLSYLLYELAKNPAVQERLFEEVRNLNLESDDFYDTVMNKLPYLSAVVNETLRKYPPVNRLERRAGVSGYKLGGVTLQKNQMVYVSQYALQHDPELFPDPESFQPERFLPENKHLIVPYSWNPFGVGPRNCVGMRFALQEVRVCVAKVMQKYQFIETPKTPKKLSFVPVGLMVVDPFELKVLRRS